MNKILPLLLASVLCSFVVPTQTARAQSTGFTYEGQLSEGGSPANGSNDLRFVLYDAATAGSTISTNITFDDLQITNGLFTVTLDWGSAPFDGSDRWLELRVRPGNGGGAFTSLSPRQKITATPYALRAVSAGTANSATSLVGPIADTSLATISTSGKVANSATTATSASTPNSIVARNASGNFAAGTITANFVGNGAGLTNVNLLTAIPAGAITLTTNAGTFGFAIASAPLVGDSPASVVAADVNGDGKVDLISANSSADTLSVLTNNGSGGFVLASSPAVGDNPTSVVAVDVNGDGKVDLISANYTSDTLSVLTNNGSGGFILAFSPVVGNGPNSVAAADVNRDGKLDLISANSSDNTLTVLTNNGSGGFMLASSPAAAGTSVVAADVNGDFAMDLISASTDSPYTVTVLLGAGDGTFVLASSPAAAGTSVAAADVNGDGKVDLISANIGFFQAGTTLTVLTNNGGGIFAIASSPTVGVGPISVTAADVNGDGKVDLISANHTSDTLSVLTNNGSGQFALATSPAIGTSPISVAAADVNGDGSVDLITANQDNDTVTVLFNTLSAVTTTAAFQGNFTGSTVTVNGNLTVGGFNIVAQSSFVTTANATLTPTSGYVKLSAASAVTLSTTTAIANGPAIGATLILEGSSDVNTVTVPHAANTRLSAPHTLGIRDMLTLIWNGINWLEVSYANNN